MKPSSVAVTLLALTTSFATTFAFCNDDSDDNNHDDLNEGKTSEALNTPPQPPTSQTAPDMKPPEAEIRSEHLRKQPMTRTQIQDVQKKLRSQGYHVGKPDGVLGKNTHAALKKFQRHKRIDVTGQPDSTTLAALGMEAPVQAAGEVDED